MCTVNTFADNPKSHEKLLFKYESVSFMCSVSDNVYTLAKGNLYIRGYFVIFDSLFTILKNKYAEGVNITISSSPHNKFVISRIINEIILKHYHNDYLLSNIKLSATENNQLFDAVTRIRQFNAKICKFKNTIEKPKHKQNMNKLVSANDNTDHTKQRTNFNKTLKTVKTFDESYHLPLNIDEETTFNDISQHKFN